MSVMSYAYLFPFEFHSPFLPSTLSDFRLLQMPFEGLKAIKIICKFNSYPASANQRLIYSFGDSGALELAVECLRVHLDDLRIIEVSLETLLTLLDSLDNEERHLGLLVAEKSNLILLMVLLERHADSRTVQSSVVMIFALLMRHKRFEEDMRTYRGFLICAPLTRLMRAMLADTAAGHRNTLYF